jgi:hypothetical protein
MSVAAIIAVAMGSQSAWAADNATADATVTLVSPVEVAKTTDLAFGQAAIPATGATSTTLIISTGGVQSGTADTVGTQTVTAAEFAVTGQGTFAYTPSITVTDAAVTGLSLSAFKGKCDAGSDQNLTVGSAVGLTGCALTAGVSTVYVGGTLTIADTATFGAWTPGTVAVTVAYN